MGKMRRCTECGHEFHSGCLYNFGSGFFCELCYDKLNLGRMVERTESLCSQIDFCDPNDNLDLFLEQLEVQDKICDMFYHQLRVKQLK